MTSNIRMTIPTMQVLEALLENPTEGLSGAEIAGTTKLLSGTLYPILHRLEKHGWVTAQFEDVDPTVVGRPRRRYYKLMPEAQYIAIQELARRGYLSPSPTNGGGDYGLP